MSETETESARALRLRIADLERKLNWQASKIDELVQSWESGADLTKVIYALRRPAKARWTKNLIIEKLHDWVERYGDPPTAMEWNPGYAKAQGREDLIPQFTAEDWPHASSVQRAFGSWNQAIIAAGYEPLGAQDGGSRRVKDRWDEDHGEWPDWHGWQMVRVFRERAGMTQAEAARKAKLSITWIRRMEAGEQDNPQLRPLLAFAAAVGVRVGALVEVEADED